MTIQTQVEPGSDRVVVPTPDARAVALDLASSDILSTQRDGNDLVIVLANGRHLVIEGYFTVDDRALLLEDPLTGDVALVEIDGNGTLLGIEPRSLAEVEEMFGIPSGTPAGDGEASLEPIMSTQGAADGGLSPLAIAGVGLLAVALVAGLAGGSDDTSGGGSETPDPETPDPTDPDPTPLEAILSNPASATGADYEAAGIVGIAPLDVGYVNDILEGINEADRLDLTSEQVQSIAELAGEFVPFGTVDVLPAFNAGEVVLNLDFDGDGFYEEVVSLKIDENYNVREASFNLDNSGGPERIERYLLDSDGNRVQAEFFEVDAGTGEETLVRRETYEESDGRMTISIDSPVDDNADEIRILEFDASGNVSRESIDYGADDTIDEVISFQNDANGQPTEIVREIVGGAKYSVENDYDSDGGLAVQRFDLDDDGSDNYTVIYSVNSEGEEQQLIDLDGDGNTDRVDTITRDLEGRINGRDIDFGGDGTIDLSDVYELLPDGKARTIRSLGDGSVVHTEVQSFDEFGRVVARERSDNGADLYYRYLEDGSTITYVFRSGSPLVGAAFVASPDGNTVTSYNGVATRPSADADISEVDFGDVSTATVATVQTSRQDYQGGPNTYLKFEDGSGNVTGEYASLYVDGFGDVAFGAVGSVFPAVGEFGIPFHPATAGLGAGAFETVRFDFNVVAANNLQGDGILDTVDFRNIEGIGLDLSSAADDLEIDLAGLETIDMSDSDNATLTLDNAAVAEVASGDPNSVFIVNGGDDDTVLIDQELVFVGTSADVNGDGTADMDFNFDGYLDPGDLTASAAGYNIYRGDVGFVAVDSDIRVEVI